MLLILFILTIFTFNFAAFSNPNEFEQIKCLVCKASIKEFQKFVNKLDPNVQIPTGAYAIDINGNTVQKLIPQKKSETKLMDILDNVCPLFDDYVRAKNKTSGAITLIKLIDDNNNMAFDSSEIEILVDENQNRGIKYICQELIGDYTEEIIDIFKNNEDSIEDNICTRISQFCSDSNHNESHSDL